jgi:hypothetical protein
MDFDTIRPFISGLIGAAVASWLTIKLAGRFPHSKDANKQRASVEDELMTLRYANIAAGIGFGIGMMFYIGGFLDRHDWRGLGIGGGLMVFLPILIIIGRNLHGGVQGIKNGFLAFSISTKTPAWLLFLFMGLMLAGGLFAAISFISKTNNAEQAGTCDAEEAV